MTNETISVTSYGRSFHVAGDLAFWEKMGNGTWEPETLQFLDRTITPDSVFIDIGAWIGPTSLFAASKGAKCHSFEPDPVAFAKFKNNIATNGSEITQRITANNVAVTSHGETVQLFTRFEFGDSGSSLLDRLKAEGSSVSVGSIKLMDYIRQNGLTRIDLVKMDIEGGEFQLLPELRQVLTQYKPVLFLALHPHYLVESKEKSDHPNRILRKLRRTLLTTLGMDAQKEQRRSAQEAIAQLLDTLKGHAYIYTPDLQPLSLKEAQQAMQGPLELVFSPRPLHSPSGGKA
ncbi:MAG: FkbM family methyltransferase [Flavobacteriales bacterium]